VGAGATAHAGAESSGSDGTTACRWGWWVVVTRQCLIGPFKLKFDRLNTNLTVQTEKTSFFTVSAQKTQKIIKITNFTPL
jgi:hypothetical protein